MFWAPVLVFGFGAGLHHGGGIVEGGIVVCCIVVHNIVHHIVGSIMLWFCGRLFRI